jgi:lipopolysaccharide/colanic/teichoic acid biosynthesis glycosyltransferase
MTEHSVIGRLPTPTAPGQDLVPRRHGAIGRQEVQAFGNLSLCALAMGRDAIGSLIDLPSTVRIPPPMTEAAEDGSRSASRDEARASASRLREEALDVYIERALRRASLLVLPNRAAAYRVSKRLMDLLGGTILFVLTLPVMAALAFVIRIDSRGPAVFRQQRVTRGGRVFTFYKFRTMYADARERFPELYDYSFTDTDFDSSHYKIADDPRNTRVGRWLRRTTLDELPNLINVLKGDLSLVGPRPELPELIYHYPPENLACLFTKAGLTGSAQVAGRSLLTIRERLTLDTRYVANQTLLLDMRILVRTALVVMTARGAF